MANSEWDEAKDRVRQAADIVQIIGEQVQLRRAGTNFSGLCPFHGEKTPSFSVNPQRQFFHCFGCGASGDVFAFVMQQQNLSFPDALKELARRYHIDLPEPKSSDADRKLREQRDELHQINREAARLYHDYLLNAPQAEAARHYLRKRGVPSEFIATYQLGYAPAQWDFIASSRLIRQFTPDRVELAGLCVKKEKGGLYDRFRDRVMFPILDASGKVAAFGGRILGDGQPKYMNSPESPVFAKGRTLFGLHLHRDAIRASRLAVVVEGNFDLLLLDVHGISNTVAPLGTALTRDHLHALRQYCQEVVFLFDGDAAGSKAARRAVPLCLGEGIEAKVALLPAGHDPDSFVREAGADGVRALLSAAAPLPEFIFEALTKEHGLTLSGKARIMKDLAELVHATTDHARRELMAAHFAEKLGVTPSIFLSGTGLEIRQPLPEQSAAPPLRSSSPLPGKQRQLLEFLVFYPEHFGTLYTQGGLEAYSRCCAPLVQEVVAAMTQLFAKGTLFRYEELIAVLPPGSTGREYVADLLFRGMESAVDEERAQECCDELLAWLHSTKSQQAGADLSRRLCEAQALGDAESVRQLTEELYRARRKHATLS